MEQAEVCVMGLVGVALGLGADWDRAVEVAQLVVHEAEYAIAPETPPREETLWMLRRVRGLVLGGGVGGGA